jgi:tetratricopeptide (TPR) repeat protein
MDRVNRAPFVFARLQRASALPAVFCVLFATVDGRAQVNVAPAKPAPPAAAMRPRPAAPPQSQVAPPATPPSPESIAATALYEQAIALVAQSKVAEACEKFKASNELDKGVGTLLRLGDCYEQLGRLASAQQAFASASTLARERADETRAGLADVRAAALKPQVPSLELRLDAAARAIPGLRITVSGRDYPIEGIEGARPMDAAEYDVVAAAPNFVDFQFRAKLVNGDGAPVVVQIPALAPVAPPPSPPSTLGDLPPQDTPESGDNLQERFGLIVGGVGAAAAVASGIFSLAALSKNSDSERECNPDNARACNPNGVSLRQDARDRAATATVLAVIGAVGLGAGATLYFTASPPEGAHAGFGLGLSGTF